jgi:hypothetical protein
VNKTAIKLLIVVLIVWGGLCFSAGFTIGKYTPASNPNIEAKDCHQHYNEDVLLGHALEG